jgi:hypothetical protein
LIAFTRQIIGVYRELGRPILALEANSKIFDEVLKPLLDAKLGENIVKLYFNLDDDSPIRKRVRININCE